MSSRHHLSRLKYAAQLWQSYLQTGTLPQLDRWLAGELKKYRQFGKQDRFWYSEILFAAVHFGYLMLFLDLARKTFKKKRTVELTSLFEDLITPFSEQYHANDAIVSAWRQMQPERFFYMLGKRYGYEHGRQPWIVTEFLDDRLHQQCAEVLEHFARYQAQANDLRFHLLWQGIPLLFAPLLETRRMASNWSQQELMSFLRNQSIRPPLWIRVNHADRQPAALVEFARHQFTVTPYQQAFQLQGKKRIFELQAYKTGIIEIQDFASQQIGVCVEAQPGEFVWDGCAGEGGKTMQIAAKLKNRGAIYASDIREYKLSDLRQRVNRAQFDNIRSFVWDGESPPELPLEVRKRGGFHWVLVDAPCTSTGVWRRKPDTKFRVTLAAIAEMTALQAKLLHNASPAVRPNGRLVYGTCSWLVDENETVINAFLAQHPDFQLISQQLHGNPSVDADTTFSAVMEKTHTG